MSMPAAERETVITGNDADRTYRVWTAERRMVTAFKKKAHRFDEWKTYEVEGSEVFEGVISADNFNPASGVKRQVSDEQRQIMAERARERFTA